MGTDRNWYEVLRVHPQAPPELIKRSFQILAQHGHPDSGGDGTIDMQDLTTARDILLNPARRKAFDEELAAREQAERRQQEAAQPQFEETVDEEVVDDWGQEEAWVPQASQTQPPPQQEQQYQPTWQPEPEQQYQPTWQQPQQEQHYQPTWQQTPQQPEYSPAYGQQFSYAPAPGGHRADRDDLFGRSSRARISGIVLLIASALPIVLGQLTRSGIDDAIFLLVLLGIGLLIGRSYIEGRKTWPFFLWVALSVVFTLSTAAGSIFAALFFGTWTVAYLTSVLTRRADFVRR